MKTLFTIILSIVLPASVFAQFNMRPSAYYQDMLIYNPASLPNMNEDNHRLLFYIRTKFVPDNEEIWQKDPTFYADYLRINEGKNSYYTVGFMNDNYSFFSRNSIYGGYGKILKLGARSTLTFGGRLALHTDIINWSDFEIPNDETGKSFRISPDVDLGAQLQWRKFKLGASLKNTVGITQKLDGEEIIKTQRAFILNVSYDFNLNENIILAPYIMLYTELKTEADIGVFMSFHQKVNASYLLRVNELRSIFTLEGRVYKGLSVGAAYDQSPLMPDNNLDLFVRYFF